jgi:hypothetical protein
MPHLAPQGIIVSSKHPLATIATHDTAAKAEYVHLALLLDSLSKASMPPAALVNAGRGGVGTSFNVMAP